VTGHAAVEFSIHPTTESKTNHHHIYIMTKQQPVDCSLGKANPGANKRRTLGFWGAISLLTAVLPASAVEIVNDTWIDGNRNQPASPTYSENGTDADADGNLESLWYSSTAANLTVVDDAVPGGDRLLRGTVAAASAISWVTYFTPEASPVTLVNPGDQLKITWVFTLTGVNAASTGQGFRVAVVNSPAASRITSETTPGSSTYAGYAIFANMRSGLLGNSESFAIRERTDNTVSAALLSSSAAWATPSLANGADTSTPGYADGVPYTYTITFTRTVANELDIAATITGTGLGVGGNGLSVSVVDATPNTFTFDTFNTRPQQGNDTATTIDTSLFKVEYLPACVAASVTTDPVNNNVALGQTAGFSVTAGGAAPTYQWQLSTDSGANWNNVSTGTGGTTANYTTAATTAPDNGNQYRCIVNVACDSSSATSAVATLNITLPKNLTWVGDGSANLWDTTTANWTGDASLFTANDNVTFNNSGSATPAIDLVGAVNANIITVNASQDYTIGTTGAGSLGGSALLNKSGTGKLTLTTANTFTGKTTVTGGTVSIAADSNLGAAPVAVVADQLTLNGGSLEATGSGNLSATRGVTLGSSGGSINVASGINFTNSSVVTGPGTLTKLGAGLLRLPTANTYAGPTTISNGTISVGNAAAFSTGTILLAGGTVDFPAATTLANSVQVSEDSTLSFGTTGNSAVVLNGVGLTGAAGKTLTVTPTGASTASTRVRVNNGLTNSFTFDANLVLNGTFTFATYNNVGDQVYNGVISGAGIMGRRSPLAGVAGRTILNGDNTYSGGTVIADGAIGFGLDSTGSPTVTSGPIGTGALTLENNPNTLHRLFASGGARTVGNAINWPAGVNQDLTIEGSDALTLNGDMDLGGSTRTIAANNTATTTLGGVISNGGLTKTGPGVLLLNGVNTYVGTTTVSNGILAGIGTIAGPLVVEAPGVLAPGTTGIGTLTVNGDLTLNGDTAVEINASTADEDLVTGIATANYGGVLTINNLAGTLAAGQNYTLFSATTHNGSFASFSPATPGAGLSWSFANGVLSVITTPVGQPTLSVSQSGNTLTFSWTGAFKLQAQTNSLSVGIANNWGDYPAGGSSPVNVTLDPANGSVFFRLINQ
jgi:autotransporter-associated beta strand protein